MTETEWLASRNILRMLSQFRSSAGERKRWLFSCACCRLIWHLLPDLCHELVGLVEHHAEGIAVEENLAERFRGFHSYNVALADLPGGPLAAQAIDALGAWWRWGGRNRDSEASARSHW
jgi:hypothetical protein